ncbi:MAG: hypothetical protein KatS3mg053_2002 [Candidatus Roseilinea sp.]|nr:MAG: hypothetical protein KatS3mg053_2002 [Candidatus Roseilinea sp.]
MLAADWSRIGAWMGGAVHSLALSPRFEDDGLALAATYAGLFRSINGGRTWQRAGDMGYVATRGVAFDPHGTARAATQAGALMRSTDGGVRWQALDTWGFGPINALTSALNQNGNMALFAATDEGIYRSMDSGASWQSANFGLLDVEILCLACAPDFAKSEIVLAGSASGGLYRSRNAGRAWREAGYGLPDAAVQCIAFTEAGLLAGTEAGVFRLTEGDEWLPCGLEGMEVNCLAACDGTLLAGTTRGIFRAGADLQWQPTGLEEPTLAVAYAANGVVLCGTVHSGIWRSDDGGRTWQRAHEGPTAHTPPLAAHTRDGAFLVADALGSVAYSDDGVAWRPVAVDDALVCVTANPASRPTAFMAATERRVLAWDADARALLPLPGQPSLDDDDTITALALTHDGVCLIGTRFGQCKVGGAGLPWHTLALPGAGAVAALHLTPAGSLFVLRIAAAGAGDAPSFSAEVWRLPVLVLPYQDESAWHMLMALDGLRAPLACLLVAGNRVVLAAQNAIAQAYIVQGYSTEVYRVNVEPGIAFTAVATHGEATFLASNRGVIYLSATGAHWPVGSALVDVPVVGLFAERAALWTVTLGGEVWRYPVEAMSE